MNKTTTDKSHADAENLALAELNDAMREALASQHFGAALLIAHKMFELYETLTAEAAAQDLSEAQRRMHTALAIMDQLKTIKNPVKH